MQIKRTGASDYGRYIKALICGFPGSGKTLISSTFPNPVYASAEGGLMSVADRDIPYVDIKNTDDLLSLKNILAQEPKVRTEMLGFEVDTVVIDTIDEIQNIMIAERLRAQNQRAMQLQDWGWLLSQMTAMIVGFRNMPLNVVFTCHLKEVSDGETGRIHYKPDLSGALADKIPGYVDLSLVLTTDLISETSNGRLEKVEKRTLLTAPSVKYPFLKDRSGKLSPEIDVDFQTDFDRLHEKIYSNVSIKETVELDIPFEEKVEEEVVEPEPEVEKISEVQAPPVKESRPSCEDCGKEVESNKRVEMSKIRFQRKIYCDSCFEKHTEEKK